MPDDLPADLYDTWDDIAARRASGDIVFQPKFGTYEALAYDAVVEILRNAATFSSRQTTMVALEPSLANLDPPVHTVLRRTLIGVFSQAAIEELTPEIVRDANALVDTLPAPGTVVDIKRVFDVKLVCAHKGISRLVDNGLPRDVGPSAKAFPDIDFVIYHSGYELPLDGAPAEGPFRPDGERRGVESARRSVMGDRARRSIPAGAAQRLRLIRRPAGPGGRLDRRVRHGVWAPGRSRRRGCGTATGRRHVRPRRGTCLAPPCSTRS